MKSEPTTNKKPATLYLKEGEFYRLKNGLKLQIIKIVDCVDTKAIFAIFKRSAKFPWETITLALDGKNAGGNHWFDVAEVWYDIPDVNWNAMPEWANYVSQDSSGEWFWFIKKPIIIGEVFSIEDGAGFNDYGLIPVDFTPEYVGNWKNSLAEKTSKHV